MQVPPYTFAILAVVSAIEVNKRRFLRQVRKDEMGHGRVFDGLGHRERLSSVSSAHGQHGVVPGQGDVKGHRERRKKGLGFLAEFLQAGQPMLVHVASRDVGRDEWQFMRFGQLQKGVVVGEVVGPQVGGGFQLVVTDPTGQKFIHHQLVVRFEHLCAKCGTDVCSQQVTDQFRLKPVHDGIVVVLPKQHHIGFAGRLHQVGPSHGFAHLVKQGIRAG